jgi:hypothetical protein
MVGLLERRVKCEFLHAQSETRDHRNLHIIGVSYKHIYLSTSLGLGVLPSSPLNTPSVIVLSRSLSLSLSSLLLSIDHSLSGAVGV